MCVCVCVYYCVHILVSTYVMHSRRFPNVLSYGQLLIGGMRDMCGNRRETVCGLLLYASPCTLVHTIHFGMGQQVFLHSQTICLFVDALTDSPNHTK